MTATTESHPALCFINAIDEVEVQITFGYYEDEPTAALFHNDLLILIPKDILQIALEQGWNMERTELEILRRSQPPINPETQRAYSMVITYPSSPWLLDTATAIHSSSDHPGQGCEDLSGPNECKTQISRTLILTVAVEGRGPDMSWAAYCDNQYSLELTREGIDSVDAVMRHGSKIRHADAARLFPDWESSDLHWRK